MSVTTVNADARLQDVLERLVAKSEEDYYNPYRLFEWPGSLPEHQYWMSPELMSVHGTEAGKRLTEGQLHAISKWESISFYSLNVHGIRELLLELVGRIYTDGFDVPSEYFHHVIGEENEHMWFFATFCLKYGGKVYSSKAFGGLADDGYDTDTLHFLVFARLLFFEEIVDFYNKTMGGDDRLHPTIRQLNAVHHQDESRHIAFGRQIVHLLHQRLRETKTGDELRQLELYLKRYLRYSLDSLVNPAAYRDAGVPDPYRFREEVLADPSHREFERSALKRTMSFLTSKQIFSDDTIPSS